MRPKHLVAICLILALPAAAMPDDKDAGFIQIQWKNAQPDFRGASTNQTIKSIKSRRSIRIYSQDQVREKDLLAVIEAGLYAPSGKNLQPWHITVVQSKDMLDKMTELYKEEFKSAGGDFAKMLEDNPDFRIFFGAPIGIIVSGDQTSEFSAIDCAAAVENMMIAAESLGLGTCWIQTNMILFDGKEGKELMKELGIPEGYKPLYTFSLGYPAEKPEVKPRKEDTVNYVK
jgi:nitroreductase